MFNAVGGLLAQQTRLDVIGNNLANTNTISYKYSSVESATVFDQLSSPATTSKPVGIGVGLGTVISGTVRNFTQGAFQRTDVPSDLGIQGDGFFTVQNAAGTNYLTRAGNFVKDSEGYLRTPEGYYLMGSTTLQTSAGGGFPSTRIQIPSTVSGESTANYGIGRDGTVTVNGANGAQTVPGYITISKFQNSQGLQSIGDNLYQYNAAAGKNEFYGAGYGGAGTIQEGVLEISNVEMAREFSEMILAQRAFDANARTVTTSDEVLQVALDLKR